MNHPPSATDGEQVRDSMLCKKLEIALRIGADITNVQLRINALLQREPSHAISIDDAALLLEANPQKRRLGSLEHSIDQTLHRQHIHELYEMLSPTV